MEQDARALNGLGACADNAANGRMYPNRPVAEYGKVFTKQKRPGHCGPGYEYLKALLV
jgi:hypothetical protein